MVLMTQETGLVSCDISVIQCLWFIS